MLVLPHPHSRDSDLAAVAAGRGVGMAVRRCARQVDGQSPREEGGQSHQPATGAPQAQSRMDENGVYPAKVEPALSLAVLPSETSGWDGGGDTRYDAMLKIVLVGESNVGKTALLTRFSDDTFSESFISTVGVDFKVRTLALNGKVVKLQIWDTAGQERFRTITSAYYRGADGILVVYDVTSQESFAHVKTWMAEISRYAAQRDQVKLLVVGNKTDLEGQRRGTYGEAAQLCEGLGAPLIETSALSSARVHEAFAGIASRILDDRAVIFPAQLSQRPH